MFAQDMHSTVTVSNTAVEQLVKRSPQGTGDILMVQDSWEASFELEDYT